MYNYKISKSRPGDNWFKVRDLKCLAWKSTEIKNYINVFAPELNVITASDTFEDAPFTLKDAIEITIEECDIWDFKRASIEEHELDKLPEDVVVFEFTMTLWVEMPELVIEFLKIELYPLEIKIEDNISENFLFSKGMMSINFEDTPNHLQKDDGIFEIDIYFCLDTLKVEINIFDFRLKDSLPISESENLSIVETVHLTKELVELLKNPCQIDKLHEHVKCIN